MTLPPALPMILALGVTQILGYGTLYYSFAVLAPGIAMDLGMGLPLVFGLFSAALMLGGLGAPFAGRMIDRHGARAVLILGSVASAAALAVLSRAQGAAGLATGLLAIELAALMATYDAAFAALTQVVGRSAARRAITTMTLLGGFASTVFWPLTGLLADTEGWRMTLLIFAGLHLVLGLPLHLSLPRPDLVSLPETTGDGSAPLAHPPLPPEAQRAAMRRVTAAFALSGFVYSAATACWVILFERLGHDAGAAVLAGTLMGPAQVAVRVLDMGFGQRLHPVTTTLVSGGLLMLALSVLGLLPGVMAAGMVFALTFGLSQGLVSIVRGTVPLTLFGPAGFGARLGHLARARMIAAALAPAAVTAALTALPAGVTVAALIAMTLLSLVLLWPLRPVGPTIKA